MDYFADLTRSIFVDAQIGWSDRFLAADRMFRQHTPSKKTKQLKTFKTHLFWKTRPQA